MSQQVVKLVGNSTDKVRQRAPQKRAEETQDHLIRAAIDLFASHGFDGVSIRMIEMEADVKRGLAAYHFGNKAELWRAAMTRLLEALAHEMDVVNKTTAGLTQMARLRAGILSFMRYSARYPQLNHVMMQESKAKTWRADYLLDNFIKPLVARMNDLAGIKIDVHTHYILIGAATFAFNVEYECETLFGINPRNDAFVEDHASAVADLLLGPGLNTPAAVAFKEMSSDRTEN